MSGTYEAMVAVIDYAIEQARQHLSAQQHKRDWWATYRAALTGLCAYCHPTNGSFGTHDIHEMAGQHADLAHGPLKQEHELTAECELKRVRALNHAASRAVGPTLAKLQRIDTLIARWRERSLEEHDEVARNVSRELADELEDALGLNKQEAQPSAADE